jgi:hypothetical protein
VSHREREALHKRIQEGLVRSAAWMLDPSDEHIASAMIVIASVLRDVVALGGGRAVTRAREQLAQLVKEGVLDP